MMNATLLFEIVAAYREIPIKQRKCYLAKAPMVSARQASELTELTSKANAHLFFYVCKVRCCVLVLAADVTVRVLD